MTNGKRGKTRRVRNGTAEALFGGYAVWSSRGRRFGREVRVWAPASIQDDDCGPGTEDIIRRLTARADPKGRRNAEVRESWRY